MVANVAQFLVDQAIHQPDAPAVRVARSRRKDGTIDYLQRSFGELENDASAAAELLSQDGIGREDRVLLMVKPGLDLIVVVFALFKIGAVPIVIDPGMGVGKFLKCVEQARPKSIVGLPAAIALSYLFRRRFRSVRSRRAITRTFCKLLSKHRRSGAFPVVASRPDELAAILFTSGSTGPAKGVRYEHGMFLAQVTAIRDQYGIKAGEVDLPMLPVFALFNPALGMCTVVPEMNPSRPAQVDPEKIVAAIQQNGVTNSFGSPALWRKIADYCIENRKTLPSLKRVLMAGAPVSPGLMEDMEALLVNGSVHTPYGATEALPVSSIDSHTVLTETASATNGGAGTCVGHPLPGVSVRIIKVDDGAIENLDDAEVLEAGSIGEIVVAGPSVTKAYDALADQTRRSKIASKDQVWHRMGDLGYLDEAGRIWFCGRAVERVVGEVQTFYTDCCEAIFNTLPQVARSALIDIGEGQPGVVIEPKQSAYPKSLREQAAFLEALRARAREYSHTRPIDAFFFERSFPVDIRHNAKIHRLKLARKYRQQTGGSQ